MENKDKALQQQLIERDKKIAQLNYLLSERDRQLTELSDALESVQSSLSWKLSYPVRFAENQGLRLKALYRTVRRTLGFGGGLWATCKKIVRIFSQEGVQGIVMRIKHIKQHHEPITPKRHGEVNLANYHLTDANKNTNIDYLAEMRAVTLEDYDVISLDVFDTALIRLFATPDGIFSYIEEQHQLPQFKKRRLEAEAQARAVHNTQKDISIEQIYQQPQLNGIDPQLEIEAELVFCVVNPIIYDLYARAKILQKKIYFVSDMYLKKEQIEQLLHKQGYKEYDVLYVSSEDHLIKGDGSRFVALKEELPGEKILHIGDNYLADYEWPKRHDIDAEHYPLPASFYEKDTLVGSLYAGLMSTQSTGLSFLLGMYKRWKYGDKSSGWGLWRDIGFLFGGPLLYLFGNYIHQQALKKPNTQLCFLARDGLIIKKVYDLLFKTPEQDSIYLLASRRAMTFPLFVMDQKACEQSELLNIYFSTHNASNADEVIERLAYTDFTALHSDLKALEKDGVIENEKALKSCLYKHYASLHAKAQDEQRGLLQYLESQQVLESNKNGLVVDVGWVGTIQDSLNQMLATTGHSKQFEGLYIGVLPIAENASTKHGFLFDKENQDNYYKLAPFRNFIELLTAAPTAGLVRFSDISPHTLFDDEPSPQESHRIDIAKEIQHGIMDFAHSIKALDAEQLPRIDTTDLLFLFELLQQKASPAVQAALSQTKHARLPSNAFTHSVIEF